MTDDEIERRAYLEPGNADAVLELAKRSTLNEEALHRELEIEQEARAEAELELDRARDFAAEAIRVLERL